MRTGAERAGLGRVTARWLAGLGVGVGTGIGLALAPTPAHAGPSGGEVVAGKATVTQDGSHTQIDTYTRRTRMSWDSFDIGQGESVNVQQPSADSRLLNRVSDASVTRIDGSLTSNGQVWIVNPAGIYFGGAAIVDVSKLVAAGGSVSDRAFRKDIQHFTDLRGEVRNDGVIHADGVALLGHAVKNNGQIVTRGGDLVMAAGDDIWVSRHDTHIVTHMPDAAGGTAPAVENTGVLDAGSGRASMAAGDLLGVAIHNSGQIRAQQIALQAGAGSVVDVSGTLDARGEQPDAKGGTIDVTGDWVNVHGATVDASGRTGGGEIHLGGEVAGGTGAKGELRNAQGTFVSDDSVVRADALEKGDGGTVAVWSDQVARVSGVLSAEGGPQGGNGGFVETSSKGRLDLGADVRVGAPAGQSGSWLLDPVNVTVVTQAAFDAGGEDLQVCPDNAACRPLSTFLSDNTFQPLKPPPDIPNPVPPPDTIPGTSLVSNQSIVNALMRGGNVLVSTHAVTLDLTTDATGYIAVAAPIEIAADAPVAPNTASNLELQAAGDIFVDQRIASDSPELQLGVTLHSNYNDVTDPTAGQTENADQERLGDVIVRAPIRTMGGNVLVDGTNIEIGADIDTTGPDPGVDGGGVDLAAVDLVRQGLITGIADGVGSLNQFGNVVIDGNITTNGGNFVSSGEQFTLGETSTIDAFRSDPSVVNSGIAPKLQVLHTDEVWIGGDLRAETVQLSAGTSGVGDLFVGQNPAGDPTSSLVEAAQIQLTAGDGTPTVNNDTGARIVVDDSATLRSPDDPNAPPEIFTYSQDAAITDADLPDVTQFGGGTVADMLYAITTRDGELTVPDIVLSSPEKVAGTNLVLSAPDSIEVQSPIHPKNVQLTLAQGFTVTPELAQNLAPVGDASAGDGHLRIYAATSGEGDLRFADGVALSANFIGLRAGDATATDNGVGTTSQVYARGEGALTYSVDPTYGSLEIRQDANITDDNVPDASQINGGNLDGLGYSLLSEGGSITLADPTKLALTNLSLTASEILFDDPINADAPLTVRSGDFGGFSGFFVSQNLLEDVKIDPGTDGMGAPKPRMLTLRAGTGNLSFQDVVNVGTEKNPILEDVQLRVEAERIRLQGATIDVTTGHPLFQVDDGTSTQRLVFDQGGTIADSVLPTAENYPDGLGPSELLVARSGVRVTVVQTGTPVPGEEGFQFPFQGDLVLTGLDVNVARTDGYNLVLGPRDNFWGTSVTLSSVFQQSDTGSPAPPIVGGRVDASAVGSVRGYQPSTDYLTGDTVADLLPRDDDGMVIPTGQLTIAQDKSFLLRSGANTLPDFGPAVDQNGVLVPQYQPAGYALSSSHGSIEVDNAQLAGTNLVLSIDALKADNLGIDENQVIDFDGSSPLRVTSLVAQAGGDLVFGADAPDGSGDGARVVADDQISLLSGLQVPTDDPNAPAGDLSFAPNVRLETPILTLTGGTAGTGSEGAVLDARTNAPVFVDLQQLHLVQGGDMINGLVDAAMPITPPMDVSLLPAPGRIPDPLQLLGYVPGSSPLDAYTITTRSGNIEINDPSELLIARSLDLAAGTSTVPARITLRADAAPTSTCQTECATGNAPTDLVLIGPGSDAEGVSLHANQIYLEAPAVGGHVNAGDPRVTFDLIGTSPVFAIRQEAAVDFADAGMLPDTVQFIGGLDVTPYVLQSLHDISVGRELADRVQDSNLVLITGIPEADFTAASTGQRGRTAVPDEDTTVADHTYDRFADRNGDGVVDGLDGSPATLPTGFVAIEDDAPALDPFQLFLRSLDIRSKPGDGKPIRLGSVTIETKSDQVYRDEIQLTSTLADPTVLTARAGLSDPSATPPASGITFDYRIDGTDAGQQALEVNATDQVHFLDEIGSASVPLGSLTIDLETLPQYQDPPPTPRAEFGSSDSTTPFLVHAHEVALNPEAGDPASRYVRSRIPDAATFFRRGGSLVFDVGSGGSFTMGEGEKLSVDGPALSIGAPGGVVTIGDLSARDRIDVDASTIHIQRRAGAKVVRANGRTFMDSGVDFVANQIAFHDGANEIDTRTLVEDQVGKGKNARFGVADPSLAPAFMDAFPVLGIEFNILTGPGLGFGGRDLPIDGIPDGISRIQLADTRADIRPEVPIAIPAVERVRDPAALRSVGVSLRAPTRAEVLSAAGGTAVFRDLNSMQQPGKLTVSEDRLVAREIQRTAVLYKRVFGADGSRAAHVRQVLQEAVDDYRRSTGARHIVGFELRRYVYNRPSSQFQAYQELQGLDALFRHQRRSGLTPTEYRSVQDAWLEAVKPEGITLQEFGEFIHPSRYVRGSDVLDVFGK